MVDRGLLEETTDVLFEVLEPLDVDGERGVQVAILGVEQLTPLLLEMASEHGLQELEVVQRELESHVFVDEQEALRERGSRAGCTTATTRALACSRQPGEVL
jgi:hypothetical protein